MTMLLTPPPLATEALDDFDEALPTYEIWLDGERFASTQVPAKAKKMLSTMTSGEAAKRYGNRVVELRITGDRRATGRGEVPTTEQAQGMVRVSDRLIESGMVRATIAP